MILHTIVLWDSYPGRLLSKEPLYTENGGQEDFNHFKLALKAQRSILASIAPKIIQNCHWCPRFGSTSTAMASHSHPTIIYEYAIGSWESSVTMSALKSIFRWRFWHIFRWGSGAIDTDLNQILELLTSIWIIMLSHWQILVLVYHGR